jgi:DNA repair protein RadD
VTRTLRPYQERAVRELRASISRGHKRVLLVLPTGGGKTVLALAIAGGHIAQGGRVLFLCHRDELVRQSVRTFIEGGIPSVRVIKADRVTGPEDAAITVASIPTLTTDRWLAKLPPATLVIFDESQHVACKSWAALASAYSDAFVIGLSATPMRADGKPLGDIYQDLVVVSTVRELTDLGWLVPCQVFAPPEYQTGLAADPVDAYEQHARGRRTIIFNSTVEHATDVARRLTERGHPAAVVHGGLSGHTRAATLERFRQGDLRVVTNVAVLTEGFDDPGVECCVLARACDHAGLYLQIIGRILRPAPDKHLATLIDLRGAVHRHGLPDADRVYSLDGDAIRLAPGLPPLKQCKRCGYVGTQWAECPACGHKQSSPKPIEVRRAELKQVFAAHDDDQRAAYWVKLQGIAAERGYASGWCHHMYVARYGQRRE